MEITAQELRIGNLILLNNEKHRPKETGNVHKIIGINEKSAHIYKVFNNQFEDYYGQFYEYLKPLPLTEEWLLKFGFEKRDVEFPSYTKQGIQINYIDGKWLEYARRIEVKTVHQLQNLYFALTGEELSIK